MTNSHRRLGVAALCGLTLVLGGCNDSAEPEPEPTASLQQPAGGATSQGSVRYQEDDEATPDADDSDDATPDADDDADDDGTPDTGGRDDDKDDDR